MMLGLGYTISATSPFILGAVRDATGSFDAVLWVAAGFLVAQFFALLALVRQRR
jgi:cyanate permease